MDRRVFLAVLLIAAVIVVTPLIFPGNQGHFATDSGTSGAVSTPEKYGAPGTKDAGAESNKPPTAALRASADRRGVQEDSTASKSRNTTAWYGAQSGALLRVQLETYQGRNPAAKAGPVEIRQVDRAPLFDFVLLTGDSSIDLNAGVLSLADSGGPSNGAVTFSGTRGAQAVRITYSNPTNEEGRYLIGVKVDLPGVSSGARLGIRLPANIESAEADTTDDIRHLAFGYKPKGEGVESIPFSKLDSGQTKAITGSLEWVALRNKYFLVAVISPDTVIKDAIFTGGRRVDKLAVTASGEAIVPLHNGQASFELYVGPQEFERLHALGYDLDHVNPYAGWLHGVVQPFANVVTRVLLWMKRSSGLSYGWVIVIFGVAVRLLLWPLNQSAMRTSIRMQRLQPELAEVQRKYKNDPEKQRDALVKLYQAHGMTPFSPMMGCLPMLLPMPILFALYFVFINTIEFRGVPFLWIHDISAADPYYITPIVMGISMFALSWIGMRGTPPTAQTRMMSYMMPIVFTFMFFRFAAGLNLYYAVQNIAALPQQWLLARERASASTVSTTAKGKPRSGKT
jgi:YidC/Oxa1 family membrane protein insertase